MIVEIRQLSRWSIMNLFIAIGIISRIGCKTEKSFEQIKSDS